MYVTHNKILNGVYNNADTLAKINKNMHNNAS
jgi:hypothetical protein